MRLLKAEEQISKHETEIRELFANKDKKTGPQENPVSNKNEGV